MHACVRVREGGGQGEARDTQDVMRMIQSKRLPRECVREPTRAHPKQQTERERRRRVRTSPSTSASLLPSKHTAAQEPKHRAAPRRCQCARCERERARASVFDVLAGVRMSESESGRGRERARARPERDEREEKRIDTHTPWRGGDTAWQGRQPSRQPTPTRSTPHAASPAVALSWTRAYSTWLRVPICRTRVP